MSKYDVEFVTQTTKFPSLWQHGNVIYLMTTETCGIKVKSKHGNEGDVHKFPRPITDYNGADTYMLPLGSTFTFTQG